METKEADKKRESQPRMYVSCPICSTTLGYNTPAIIKYPFWRFTNQNPNSPYACINYGEVVCPDKIKSRSICIDGDISETLAAM